MIINKQNDAVRKMTAFELMQTFVNSPNENGLDFNTEMINMTCYFRHMKEIFAELGVEVTPENKRELDRRIHEFLGVEYKNCSASWKAIKEKRSEDGVAFLRRLKKALTTK